MVILIKVYLNLFDEDNFIYFAIVPSSIEKLNIDFNYKMFFSYRFIKNGIETKLSGFTNSNYKKNNILIDSLTESVKFTEITENFSDFLKKENIKLESFMLKRLKTIIEELFISGFIDFKLIFSEKDFRELKKIVFIIMDILTENNMLNDNLKHLIKAKFDSTYDKEYGLVTDGEKIYIKNRNHIFQLPSFELSRFNSLSFKEINNYELMFNNNLREILKHNDFLKNLTELRDFYVKTAINKKTSGIRKLKNEEFYLVFKYDVLIEILKKLNLIGDDYNENII